MKMEPETIVKAVRSLVCSEPDGNRAIVVLDRGWIFVGHITGPTDNGMYKITNCQNVRIWKQNGFGGVCRDPKAAGVILDPASDIRCHQSAIIFIVPISEEWGNE